MTSVFYLPDLGSDPDARLPEALMESCSAGHSGSTWVIDLLSSSTMRRAGSLPHPMRNFAKLSRRQKFHSPTSEPPGEWNRIV